MTAEQVYTVAHSYFAPMAKLGIPQEEIERSARILSGRYLDTEELIQALKQDLEDRRAARRLRA